MADEPDPPRTFYGLKPREFERLNDAPSAPMPPPSSDTKPITTPPSPALPSPAAGRIDVHDLTRAATHGTPLLGVNVPAQRANEVHAMLRENLARADAAGLNDAPPPAKRRSRRRRDYFLVLILVNAFFGFWAFGPYANAMTFVYGLAGIVMFTLCLTWIMWFIMDDY